MLEAEESTSRLANVGRDPTFADPLNRQRIEVIPTLSSLSSNQNQIGFDENVQVLHHPEPTQGWAGFDQLSRRCRPLPQAVQEMAAGPIREGLPD